MSLFTKFLWMELIGFDNTQSDYGVAEFLARMNVKPEGISILIWNTELIHAHDGLEKDDLLGASHCAYCGRPRNEEHERQEWTKFQLKELIDILHRNSIKVFVSFFDQVVSDDFEWKLEDCSGQWIARHPEVRSVFSNGRISGSICRLKHLSDGSLYEDFLISQLERFLIDYGFDGLHCADGYSHPRYAICDADFSDDMIFQFMESEKIHVPDGSVQSRAEWILREVRLQWMEFHGKRNGQFWRKCLEMLDCHHLDHLFNTCWTRDPFEAYFRYGVDYRRLAEAGVKNWIVEAQAAVIETEGWNQNGIPMQDQYRAVLLRLKALMPEGHFYLLHCIKDGMEQYNVLRHAPAFMDSDIYGLSGLIYGKKRILEGMMVCLADGISSSEWHRLDSVYEKVFAGKPETIPFPHVLFSSAAMYRELSRYVQERNCSSFHLHACLFASGASLMGEISASDLKAADAGPLVLLNPWCFSEKEKQSAWEFSRGNIAEIGLTNGQEFICRIWQNGVKISDFSCSLDSCTKLEEISTWLKMLPENMPPCSFLTDVSKSLNKTFARFMAESVPESVRLYGFEDSEENLHFFIENEKNIYHRSEVIIKGGYSQVHVVSEDAMLPPRMKKSGDGMYLTVKIPPSGTIPLILS